MNANLTPRRAALLAAALAVLVHVGALANGFAYDDLILITGDPGIRQWDGLAARLMEPSWPAAFGDEIGAWRPLTTATWALVWIVAGGGALAFHALGVLLHAAVSALGVLLFAEFFPLTLAAGAGVLFAVHPVHTEAVANVVGSAEPLAALFVLAAALVHVRGDRSYGPARVAAVAGLYGAAVLAKESAAVLPFLVFLLDAVRNEIHLADLRGYLRDRLLLFVALFAVLTLILLARLDVVGAVAAASHPPGGEMLRDAPRSWTVFSTWPIYLRLLFAPTTLAADYSPGIVPVVFRWSSAAALGAVIGLASFTGALVAWRRGRSVHRESPLDGTLRVLPFSLLWIAGCMLPVANVLYLAPVLVAERTFYLASWGAALTLAWVCLALLRQRQRLGVLLLGVLTLAGSVRTVTRVPAWTDTETVMQALIDDYPQSGTGWMHLGRRLASEGRADDARTAFTYAVVLLNSEYRPVTEIASHLVATGRPEAARPLLRRAWREHPGWYTAPGLLAAAELSANRPDLAVPAARAAVILQGDNPSMHHLLAQALAGTGDWKGAATARRASLDTGFADRGRSWLLLGQELIQAGDTMAAAAAVDSAAARELTAPERQVLAELRTTIGMSNRP